MKKGVVLFITIAFVTIISIFILKNLDNTDKYLENQNFIVSNTQLLISIQNTQEQVSKILVNNKNTVDKFLEDTLLDSSIPLKINIEDLKIDSTFNRYEKVDINTLSKDDKSEINKLFMDNNIFNFYLFLDIYTEILQRSNKNITNRSQLYDIINTFTIRDESSEIEKIINDLGFIDGEDLYELNVNAEYLNAKAKAYYILNKSGEVEYFDISFK
ncbi:hypothetical protein [Halarcobacter sp.]|uniref:hypothetical protein n=1 Tax=Halarcobacter sp. TaxID=2321133 RepID=UPI002AA7D248|nr:hypothetical protein [Halarcobacter sp.]